MEAEQTNPYQSPQYQGVPARIGDAESYVNQALLFVVRRTKGWVRFISVVVFIAGILSTMVALGLLLIPDMRAGFDESTSFPGGAAVGIGIYLFGGLINLVFATLLWRMANRYRDLLNQPNGANLVDVLGAQRGYWRLVGIVLILVALTYLALILLVIITV